MIPYWDLVAAVVGTIAGAAILLGYPLLLTGGVCLFILALTAAIKAMP